MILRPLWLPLVAGLCLIGCAAGNVPRATPQAPTPAAARAADGFFDLTGKPTSLAAVAGQPVVLSFLAPGEADSDAQLPHLIRLAGAYVPEGVAFLIAGERATPTALQGYVAQHGLTFPVWEDRQAREWTRRGFTRLPAHEFRRASGAIAHSQEGFMSRGELLSQLAALTP